MGELIARFTLDPETSIPSSSLDFAATLLLDTIAVAAGAKSLEVGTIMRDAVLDLYGAGNAEWSARMMFDGRRASLAGAAYALASQIDNLDAHDGWNPTKGHIGCAAVPALFAFAERRPDLTGKQALEALVIAYEVAARAAMALHATVSDYHTSGAWNALGVAAMGCRLFGADSEQLRHALGIAEYHGPRSQMMREIAHPTMLHDGSGPGALTGVTAAILAMRGFEGAPAITVEADDVKQHWQDLGERWTVELNYIKPYPVCRWAHAAIDATQALMRAHGFAAGEIDSCQVNTFDEASKLFAGMPDTTSKAQYSLAFAVANMLYFGRIDPDHVRGHNLANPEIAALIDRIEMIEDRRHSERFPLARWSDVTIKLKDGRVFASGDVHARGGPEAPMAIDEIEDKFKRFAAGAVDDDRAQKIWSMGREMLSKDVLFSDFAALICRN